MLQVLKNVLFSMVFLRQIPIKFDDAYTVAVTNKSVPNLTFTAQYATVSNVVATNTEDVNLLLCGCRLYFTNEWL